MAHNCKIPEGMSIKPDGVHELESLCPYELMEEHKNVTVKIYQCPECGGVEISWFDQDNSEHIIYKPLKEG